ncbi:uncharacterized protein RCO7_14571 [Rhynchosporium graminicola]|uniref:Uncharacterized protein n=1 Tax=Rhynchosporium graminicola TaxID=2792576 RepID=A0A1E1KPS4_9HELO|nr:uncharacterized protein RCO7_14571 [Rhynchosporium commune]
MPSLLAPLSLLAIDIWILEGNKAYDVDRPDSKNLLSSYYMSKLAPRSSHMDPYSFHGRASTGEKRKQLGEYRGYPDVVEYIKALSLRGARIRARPISSRLHEVAEQSSIHITNAVTTGNMS